MLGVLWVPAPKWGQENRVPGGQIGSCTQARTSIRYSFAVETGARLLGHMRHFWRALREHRTSGERK
jgi:hypothetical protein